MVAIVKWDAMRDDHNERRSWTEYLEIIERDPEHRYEYFDGYVYMMTGGSNAHAVIGANIITILRIALKGRPCIVYSSDAYVQIAHNYRFCPDATVSCDPRDRAADDSVRYPSLVVEVLSPTTEARDRGKKALQYRSCPSMQAYLLVNVDAPLIEIFRREENGFWTLYTVGKGEMVELTKLGIRFSVDEIYENTFLDENVE